MQNMLALIELGKEDEGITMTTERDEVGRDGENGEMKALLKEQ